MYRFGDCEIDIAARELRRGGELVHLEPQAFDLLVLLIEQRTRVVSKMELLDGVWGHQFVSEANLTTRVKEARRAVGDDGSRQAVIRNVRGRGYRFVAALEGVDRSAPVAGAVYSGLIGRASEVRSIVELVHSSALVTIMGPGGVGKSTLARAVAAGLGSTFADGDHVVELAALEASGDVTVAVAQALDVVVDRGRPDDAIRALARLHALVVLDNCEHVIDDVTALVGRVLAVPDVNLRILATSQVRLGVSAETVVAIAPLSVADGSALFVERARAVSPSFDTEAIGREQVERLVSVLDRLPLTIEMAAARLGSMTFDELASAIADGSALLKMTHRAPAHRHRSLSSVVEWSADLLDPTQRELFSAFSVFAGAVPAADACAVLSPADSMGAKFELATLAERSLLAVDVDESGTRYSMLTTVRAVAARWLDESDQADTVRRRHALHIADVLRGVDGQLRTNAEPDGRRRLAGIVDEVRVACRWSAEHEPQLASDMSASLFHAAHSTMWHEPAEWIRGLVHEQPDRATNPMWGAVLMSAGVATSHGEVALARAQATAAEQATEGRLRGIALELLADIALITGEAEPAVWAASELRRVGDELGDAHFMAFAVVDLALAHTLDGDPGRALDALDADLPELAPTDAAWMAYARGIALLRAGDRRAVDAFVEAIDLGTVVGNRYVIPQARAFLAVEYTRVGESGLALDAFADAFREFLRHGDYSDATTKLRNVLGLFASIGEYHGAVLIGAQLATERVRTVVGIPGAGTTRALDAVRQRVGDDQFSQWFDEGHALDLDTALDAVIQIIDRRR